METKVVKWEKRRQAGGGEMEKGQPGGEGEGKKNARSERKAKQKRGAKRSKATEKSRGAVTRQVPSSGF